MMKVNSIVSVGASTVVALCDDGSLWTMDINKKEWERCPHIYSEEGMNKMPVQDLMVSTRIYNALSSIGIEYMGELVKMSDEEIKKIPRLGDKSLAELFDALQKFKTSHGLMLAECV